MRCATLGHDVRSIARAASVAPATTFKRGNRPFEVLELDLSRLPTHQARPPKAVVNFQPKCSALCVGIP
jgi:hypothetical protein